MADLTDFATEIVLKNLMKKSGTRQSFTGRKRLLFSLVFGIILMLTTVLLFACLEFVASFFTKRPSDAFVRDARLNHTFPPHSADFHDDWIRDNPEFPKPYTHRYNKQGWIENYDITLDKPKNTYRIFYVGDSFTEGCVPMEENVASRVETYVNQHYARKDLHFEVINTGTMSYSPAIYYVLVRYYLLDYSPDLIVVNVDMTDDYDDWKYRRDIVLDSEGAPWAVPAQITFLRPFVVSQEGAMEARPLTRLSYFLYEKSYIYNFILGRERLKKMQNLAPTWAKRAASGPYSAKLLYPKWAWCQHDWDEKTRENVKLTLANVERLVILCKKNHVKLLLTGVPHYNQFVKEKDGRYKWSIRPHKELERIARKHGVIYLDSHQSLRGIIEGTPQHQYYYRNDTHFNPKGNRLWAEAHIKAISDPKNHLLPESVWSRTVDTE